MEKRNMMTINYCVSDTKDCSKNASLTWRYTSSQRHLAIHPPAMLSMSEPFQALKIAGSSLSSVNTNTKASTSDALMYESTKFIQSRGRAGNRTSNPRGIWVYVRVSMARQKSYSDGHLCRSCSSPGRVIPPSVLQPHISFMMKCSKRGDADTRSRRSASVRFTDHLTLMCIPRRLSKTVQGRMSCKVSR